MTFPTVSGKSFKIPWFQSPPTVVFSQPLAWILAWPRPRTESAHTSKRHLGWGRQIPGKSAGIVADWILRGFSWSPLKYYSLVMCFLQFAKWKMAIEIVDLPVFHSYVSLPVGSISAKKIINLYLSSIPAGKHNATLKETLRHKRPRRWTLLIWLIHPGASQAKSTRNLKASLHHDTFSECPCRLWSPPNRFSW